MKSPQPNRMAGAEWAAGVLLGLVAFQMIGALVSDLIAPLIAVFIGDSRFQLNAFVIEGSEFNYGHFLEAVFVAAIAGAVIVSLFSRYPKNYWGRTERDNVKDCPECTSIISIDASRCPFCTSQLARRSTNG
jgi:large conductance mechanosensitive channel